MCLKLLAFLAISSLLISQTLCARSYMHNPRYPAHVCNCMYHYHRHSKPMRSLDRSLTVCADSSKPHAWSGPNGKLVIGLHAHGANCLGYTEASGIECTLGFRALNWQSFDYHNISWTRQI